MYQPEPLYKPLYVIGLDHIYWDSLSKKPNAIPLLEANPDKIES
jgi:hypothetical protein